MACSKRGKDVKKVQGVMGRRRINRYEPEVIVRELSRSITAYSALMMKFGATLPTVKYYYTTDGPYEFITYKMKFIIDLDMFEYFNQTTSGFTP